jgi:NhaP-type Na+/H+ or K+/H+ antiporter
VTDALVLFVLVLAVVVAVGGVLGILVSRRLTRWEDRQEESSERDHD